MTDVQPATKKSATAYGGVGQEEHLMLVAHYSQRECETLRREVERLEERVLHLEGLLFKAGVPFPD